MKEIGRSGTTRQGVVDTQARLQRVTGSSTRLAAAAPLADSARTRELRGPGLERAGNAPAHSGVLISTASAVRSAERSAWTAG